MTPSNSTNDAPHAGLRSPVRGALVCWCVLTAVILTHIVGTYLLFGRTGLEVIVREGPLSTLRHTLLAVGWSWILVGGTLALLATRRLTPAEVLRLACFLWLAFLYGNVMRERNEYGDVGDYISAAESLYSGATMPERYLYPPFWAALLAPLAPLGSANVMALLWLLNLLSLCALFLLLSRILERYGFPSVLATVVAFLFCVVNTPILRTLGYVQVNIHVTNLILACLWLYPQHRVASALVLSLAVSIKMSPLVLILPFVYVKDFRWLLAFAVSILGVNLIPAMAFGWSPYVDFAHNVINMRSASAPAFRENSVDSFLGALVSVTGVDRPERPYVVGAAKLLLASSCALLASMSVRRQAFLAGRGSTAMVYNAVPAILVLMVIVSPLVWEHHPVMMGLAYIVLIKRISSSVGWIVFALAYYLQFLVPTFDLFPWSYGRLLSAVVWLGLARLVIDRGTSQHFEKMAKWTTRLLSESSGPVHGGTPPGPPASRP